MQEILVTLGFTPEEKTITKATKLQTIFAAYYPKVTIYRDYIECEYTYEGIFSHDYIQRLCLKNGIGDKRITDYRIRNSDITVINIPN